MLAKGAYGIKGMHVFLATCMDITITSFRFLDRLIRCMFLNRTLSLVLLMCLSHPFTPTFNTNWSVTQGLCSATLLQAKPNFVHSCQTIQQNMEIDSVPRQMLNGILKREMDISRVFLFHRFYIVDKISTYCINDTSKYKKYIYREVSD